MHDPIPKNQLLAHSFDEINWDHVYRLDTKRYAPNYLTNDDANTLPWHEFRHNSHALAISSFSDSDLEGIILPKSVTWSDRDVNIYVGSNRREIRSFLDFSESDFVTVFEWQINILSDLSSEFQEPVYCTHGFNATDTSPDAHSIRSKFHTHIHIPNKDERTLLGNNDLNMFEKLMLVEPFADIFWDYAAKDRNMTTASDWKPQQASGYFSLETPLSNYNSDSLQQIHRLMTAIKDKYDEAVDIFTSREVETETGFERYIPRSLAHREELLANFISTNQDWLSSKSIALLSYLVENIRDAQPRNNDHLTSIENGSQLWIAKDFSGALNFSVSAQQDTLRFSFAPRIVSTSGATKILSDQPTIIVKNTGEADLKERARMLDFESRLARAALKNV